jgi:hypothetical protein
VRYLLIFDQEPDVGCFAYVDVNDNVNFDMLVLVLALAFDAAVAVSCRQCCGSGSGIRCRFDPWIRDPGWIKSQDPDPG